MSTPFHVKRGDRLAGNASAAVVVAGSVSIDACRDHVPQTLVSTFRELRQLIVIVDQIAMPPLERKGATRPHVFETRMLEHAAVAEERGDLRERDTASRIKTAHASRGNPRRGTSVMSGGRRAGRHIPPAPLLVLFARTKPATGAAPSLLWRSLTRASPRATRPIDQL